MTACGRGRGIFLRDNFIMCDILFVFCSRRHGPVPPLRGGACGGTSPHLCGRGFRLLLGKQTCTGEAPGAPAPSELLTTRE